MAKELAKQYNPADVEDRTYKFWCDHKYFHAEVDKSKKPYTIVIPPPNITGQLHMGHALDNTLQDILIRWRRMQGYEALWLPGTDHASIATEAKIVEAMRKEGVTKEEIGREEFLKRAWAWKEQYGSRIIEQLKKMGSSCDWDRERFTMDEGCSKAVKEVFVNLYNKGLIYQGKRMVNWCPHCRTTISDAEVEYEDQAGHFWHLRYPFKDGSGYVELATTRPETMLGDTAVAVNPNDERYKDIVGKTLILPIVHREIPVVADDYVDVEFGTGVVKITPAHDPNDYEVGLRHNLEIIDVMTDDGHIADGWGKYSGMDRYECRNEIVKDLEAEGALIKVEDYNHNVGTCYRCHSTIEPRLSKQWFVKMEPLAKPAIEVVKEGKVKFVPERFSKIYYHWMENIKDWCISRQLWWGHRIPAYYCADCGEVTVSKEDVYVCPKCGSKHIEQDPDTLDTWFSSALWPFSTLGWPDKTPELEYFYPTNTLVTGYDIIFFWVARMIFSAVEHTGEVPFDTVLIHGLVRDAQGRKMSKSLGNGIDPLEVIDEYGADALRFTLATGNSPGNDMRFSDDKVKASRNFANKLWNAARFVLMYLGEDYEFPGLPKALNLEDKWIISKVNTLSKEVTANLEKFELGVAIQKLYDFIWDVFCDWYIEISKIRLQSGEGAETAKAVLVYVLTDILKLLHPFMPFITEEIYQAIPHDTDSIMISKWVEYDEALNFAAEEEQIEKIMQAVRAIRNRRAQMNIPPSRKAAVFVETDDSATFEYGAEFIKRLAYASEVTVSGSFDDLGNVVTMVTDSAKIYIPMGELVDFEAERKRLEKELAAAQDKLDFINKKLSNPGFVNKAPEKVVNQNREDAAKLEEKIAGIKESIASIGQ
ncbi:MAG TPA: valine--tRNA ligase [Candidatus Eubacterium faecipullorum]|uniref:Valine--tRNA ligase n=1 Tax=Candidatus Eubacterium faecipullorum TaxID=2838571 RepID=A0A9D1UH90_9FIRM|nr:valine--tRNA ligase [Candidatus Eubacterium faecipullorum]